MAKVKTTVNTVENRRLVVEAILANPGLADVFFSRVTRKGTPLSQSIRPYQVGVS